MNQLGFNGKWKWGRLGLGSVNPTFSRYGLSGVTLRGGYMELFPGAVVAGLALGQSKRATTVSSEQAFAGAGSYAQNLLGLKFGFGNKDSFVGLSTTFVKDDTTSVEAGLFRGKPIQNVTLTPELTLPIIPNKITLQLQGTGSLYTADAYAEAIKVIENPDFMSLPSRIQKLATSFLRRFPIRTSTQVNGAANGELRVSYPTFGFRGGYEWIGPNFQSAGIGYLQEDRQTIYVQPSVRLFKRKLTLGGQFNSFNNNVSGLRNSTITRRNIGLNLQARFGTKLMLSGSFTQMNNQNVPTATDAKAQEGRLDQKTQVFMLAPVLMLRSGSLSHTVSLTAMQQQFKDQSPAVLAQKRPASDFLSRNFTLAYNLAFASGLGLSVNGNLLKNDNLLTAISAQGLNLGATSSVLDRKLNLSLNGGFTRNASNTKTSTPTENVATQWISTFNANYMLTRKDAAIFSLQAIRNQTDPTASFGEMIGQLRIEHRF